MRDITQYEDNIILNNTKLHINIVILKCHTDTLLLIVECLTGFNMKIFYTILGKWFCIIQI